MTVILYFPRLSYWNRHCFCQIDSVLCLQSRETSAVSVFLLTSDTLATTAHISQVSQELWPKPYQEYSHLSYSKATSHKKNSFCKSGLRKKKERTGVESVSRHPMMFKNSKGCFNYGSHCSKEVRESTAITKSRQYLRLLPYMEQQCWRRS